MRTLIDIPEDMARSLSDIGVRRKTSRAGIIREALGEYLSRHKASEPGEGFGAWGKRAGDGLAFQRKIRGEW
jgi:metal-responsive CopG/Arc/MetJ family transcriptional regulator